MWCQSLEVMTTAAEATSLIVATATSKAPRSVCNRVKIQKRLNPKTQINGEDSPFSDVVFFGGRSEYYRKSGQRKVKEKMNSSTADDRQRDQYHC